MPNTSSTQQKNSTMIGYILISVVGVLLAMYFVMGEIAPDVLADLGLPVLVQGTMAYICAVVAVCIGDYPMIRFLLSKNKNNPM